jgi:hypothetical protein
MGSDYAIFDAATGERTGSVPPPSSPWAGPPREWAPPLDLVSESPSDAPYETGEKPSVGPTPCNIVGGELAHRDMDDAGSDTDDGFDCGDICNQVGDGEDDPHDQPTCDTDCDDSGPTADNIRSARGPSAGSSNVFTMPTLGRFGR